jgi:uncharacterized membrane protein SpoIIM required for sporulation
LSLESFVQERRPVWERLRTLVDLVHRRGPRRAGGRDLNEMLHLYREVSADLARLRALGADPALVREVNRLMVRGHAQIYRDARVRRGGMLKFFMVTYPQLFRRTVRYSVASLSISTAFALMAFFAVQNDPGIVADIMGTVSGEFSGEKTGEDIRARFQGVAAPMLSSMVTTNNIVVALNAFALGITFGVGTVYALIVNGTMLGGFAGAYTRSGAGTDFWMTVLTHGALELTAIVIAGGAGLMIGYALWCPGQRTRRRALREAAIDAVQLVLGLIPAFLIAGFLEGFVTPNDGISAGVKTVLGMLVATTFWLYLLFAGRESGAIATGGDSV